MMLAMQGLRMAVLERPALLALLLWALRDGWEGTLLPDNFSLRVCCSAGCLAEP